MSKPQTKTVPKINEAVISAGFGGQGIMVLGKVLAAAGMEQGLHVTYLPAYGAEVRGGTAYSMVRISSLFIASPIIVQATAGIILNEPSFDKFENQIEKGGLLILNSSLVKRPPKRKDLEVVTAPLTDEAVKLGNVRVANMIAVGIFMARKKTFEENALFKVIEKMAAGYEERIPINIKAVEKGVSLASVS